MNGDGVDNIIEGMFNAIYVYLMYWTKTHCRSFENEMLQEDQDALYHSDLAVEDLPE